MGQKTHPGGFRLNTTQEHDSNWAQKSWANYSKNLERDYLSFQNINSYNCYLNLVFLHNVYFLCITDSSGT